MSGRCDSCGDVSSSLVCENCCCGGAAEREELQLRAEKAERERDEAINRAGECHDDWMELVKERDALIFERDALKAEVERLRGINAAFERNAKHAQIVPTQGGTGAVSERARLIYEGATQMYVARHVRGDAFLTEWCIEEATGLLRAAEAEARKGGEEAGREKD